MFFHVDNAYTFVFEGAASVAVQRGEHNTKQIQATHFVTS